MTEDDIYGSRRKYENFIADMEKQTCKPKKGGKRKYYCKNKKNLKYFKKLINGFEAKDLSFIRRNKIFFNLRLLCTAIDKDLVECDRDDINGIVAFMHKRYKSVESKKDFIKDMKVIWRMLFPEKDSRDRIDETLTPYAVRHISSRIDKSKEKLRNERFNLEEFEKIVAYFNKDPKIQAYLTLAFESLGRPQEILFTKVKDYEFYDNYAKIWISEHGKEGTGFLQSIDSYPYIMKWFEKHPLKHNPDAYFFVNESNHGNLKQMTNNNVNKRLKVACNALGINKSITCYSLKRNGITYRRLRGDSDTQIQHAARWTSTKQLKVYDMSTQEDALRIELVKRGLVDPQSAREKRFQPQFKVCTFCGSKNGFTMEFCSNCKRPMKREKIKEIAEKHDLLQNDQLLDRLHVMEKRLNDMMKVKV